MRRAINGDVTDASPSSRKHGIDFRAGDETGVLAVLHDLQAHEHRIYDRSRPPEDMGHRRFTVIEFEAALTARIERQDRDIASCAAQRADALDQRQHVFAASAVALLG